MAEGVFPSGDVTSDDKLWALLSWLFWPVALVMLLMDEKKQRPFIKYNAVQSLAYAVPWYVIGTITVGCVLVAGAVYAIILGVKAYKGEWVTVPVITDFCKKQGWI
jgi:uncharacterized membrane protein